MLVLMNAASSAPSFTRTVLIAGTSSGIDRSDAGA